MGLNAKKAAQQEAIEQLRKYLSPGDTVYCILRHVSRSGMSRTIQLIKMTDAGPTYLGSLAADALGWGWDGRRSGVKVAGCGMDMGFHLVYQLSATLWPQGLYARTTNERVNERDRDASRSGYWLRSEWL